MELLEGTLGLFFVVWLPALSVLTALQPIGRFYIASTLAAIALFCWCFHLAMDGADGPVGFGVGLYFALVAATFIVAHLVKHLVLTLKLVVRSVLKARRR